MGTHRIRLWNADEVLLYELDASTSLDVVTTDGAVDGEAASDAPPDVVVVADGGDADVGSVVSEAAARFPETRIVVLDSLDRGVPTATFDDADAVLGRTLPPARIADEITTLLVSATRATGVALPSEPDSVATARRLVRHVTSSWGGGDLTDTVALLATELVANAVRHGGDDIDIVIRVAEDCVRVEVRDSSDAVPTKRDASDDKESGRGVALVDALSEAWGCDPTVDGKSVWFELRRDTD